jgi:TP901 family phage tail tape measure protein
MSAISRLPDNGGFLFWLKGQSQTIKRSEEMAQDVSFIVSCIDEFSKPLDNLQSKFDNIAGVSKKVGGVLTGMGVAGAAGFGYAIKTAADFEQGMKQVQSLSGATGKEFDTLTDTAKELGRTTSFSASQASEGMSYLAMAGFETNDIVSAMPGVLNAAAAGNVSLADSANIASNVLSGFGLEASETANVADVLTKTFTSSNTTMNGLGETMKYVAPAANAVGWSLEEMSAAAGMLGDVSIDASQAGTSLRSAITRLAAPTGAATELMEQYGINISDANGNMLPLHDILGQMDGAFSDLSDTQQAAAMQTIFGTESMSAMLALMDNPQELMNFTQELQNAGGTAEAIATNNMDTLWGAIDKLKSAFEGLVIDVGTHFIPLMTSIAEKVNGVVSWFNNLSPVLQKGIVMFAAIATAAALIIGPALIIIGFIPQLVAGFGMVATATKALGVAFTFLSANPVGLVIAAIVALVGVIAYLWNTNESFRAAVIKIWGAISNAITSYMNAMKNVIRIGVDFFKSTFSNGLAFLKALVKGDFEGMKDAVSSQMENIKNTIQRLMDNAINFLKNINLYNIGKDIIQGLLNGITNMTGKLFSKAAEIANGIKDKIKGALNINSPSRVMMELGEFTGEGLTKGLTNSIAGVTDAAGAMAGAAVPDIKRASNQESRVSNNTSNVYNYTINVDGNIDRDLYDEIQRKMSHNANTKLRVSGVKR